MLARLKQFLTGEVDDAAEAGPLGRDRSDDEMQAAVAALLVEAAQMDGSFDEAERDAIAHLLAERFELSEDEVADVIATAEAVENHGNLVFSATQAVRDGLDYEGRVGLMEMLWEVAYADGEIHDWEANLARRVAGLIHVQDKDSGIARKRVRERLGITG